MNLTFSIPNRDLHRITLTLDAVVPHSRTESAAKRALRVRWISLKRKLL